MKLLVDFVVATGLALIFLLLSWAYGRVLSRGHSLNLFKKRLLGYAFAFALGMIYLTAAISHLHWTHHLLFPMIAIWGVLVGAVAWWRHRDGNARPSHD